MKKFFAFLLILIAVSGIFTVSAITQEELVETMVGMVDDDFGMLLNGLATDFEPILLQNALSGQNIGMAELGSDSFSHFYISVLPTVSFTFANGMFGYRDTPAYEETLVLEPILDNLLFGDDALIGGLLSDETWGDYVNLLLNEATPFPAVKMNAGVKLPMDMELLVYGMWIPTALFDMAVDYIPDEFSGLEPSFTYINAGGELRYVLLRDGKWTPGMSIGIVGSYNKFHVGLGLGELLEAQLADMVPDGMEYPFDGAGMSLDSSVLAFGINTSISKKLAIFYPFVKLGAWYNTTDFTSEVVLIEDNEDAIISESAGDSAFDLLFSTGFDVLLGPLGSNLTVDYNLGSGIWGLSLGSRLQL